MSPGNESCPRDQVQRLTCYPTGVVEATARWPGQPHAAHEARPREPGGGPATGAARPRMPYRGGSPRARPRIREREGGDAVGTASTASTASHFAGIDVSKDTLDAALLGPGGATRAKPFANDPAGHAALLAWADRHAAGGAVHYRMEATGPYSAAIATSLHGAGRVVSVANPARVKAHAKACGQANEPDPADARAIAVFCRDRRPRPCVPPAPERRQLRGLVRRRDDLRRMAAAEKTRLDAPDLTPAARTSIARAIRFLSREADRVQAEAEAVVAATPGLAADCELL